MGSNVQGGQRFRRFENKAAQPHSFEDLEGSAVHLSCSRRSDFRAASPVCEGHSFRSTARHPLHNDTARRHADDLRPAKSFAACDVESIIRVASSRSAPIISVISITITITVVNADATGADPQLQVLRGRNCRRDRQPAYRSQADQYELKRFAHEFLPWSYAYPNDNIAMRDLFLEARGLGGRRTGSSSHGKRVA